MRQMFEFMQKMGGDDWIKKHRMRRYCPTCKTNSLVYWTRNHDKEVIAIECDNCDICMMGFGMGSTVEEFCKNAIECSSDEIVMM